MPDFTFPFMCTSTLHSSSSQPSPSLKEERTHDSSSVSPHLQRREKRLDKGEWSDQINPMISPNDAGGTAYLSVACGSAPLARDCFRASRSRPWQAREAACCSRAQPLFSAAFFCQRTESHTWATYATMWPRGHPFVPLAAHLLFVGPPFRWLRTLCGNWPVPGGFFESLSATAASTTAASTK